MDGHRHRDKKSETKRRETERDIVNQIFSKRLRLWTVEKPFTLDYKAISTLAKAV